MSKKLNAIHMRNLVSIEGEKKREREKLISNWGTVLATFGKKTGKKNKTHGHK